MLEGILKGLLQWLYSLILEIVEYIANGLLEVFSMDLRYFEAAAPVVHDIVGILIACGWALLLGNLVFQAAKTMMTGLGFEGEDPRMLFTRTFVFGFFLLASRQICEIGLGLAGTVIAMLQVPDSITVSLPGENIFSIGASWLLVIIIGFVLMFQIVKLFFEIGERYFIVGFLTLMAPMAFAMGGSKNTSDIFKGWVRMYGSMCLMMVLNVVFLKILLSAMGTMPSDAGVLAWMVFVVAIARVGRKADELIMRIGLNPAITGSGLGSRLPGMLSMTMVRTVASTVAKTVKSGAAGNGKTPSAGGTPHGGNPSGPRATSASHNSTRSQTAASSQAHSTSSHSGTAGTDSPGVVGAESAGATLGTVGTQAAPASAQAHGAPGLRGSIRSDTRRSAAQTTTNRHSAGGFRLGTAGRGPASADASSNTATQPGPGGRQPAGSATELSAGTAGIGQPKATDPAAKASRFTSVPAGARSTMSRPSGPGTAGTAAASRNTHIQQGGTISNVQNTSLSGERRAASSDQHDQGTAALRQGGALPTSHAVQNQRNTHSPGTAGIETRRRSASKDKPSSAAAPPERRSGSGSSSPAPTRQPGGKSITQSPTSGASPSAPPERGRMGQADTSRKSQVPPGTAGKDPVTSTNSAEKKPGPVSRPTSPQRGVIGLHGEINRSKKDTRRSKGGTDREQ